MAINDTVDDEELYVWEEIDRLLKIFGSQQFSFMDDSELALSVAMNDQRLTIPCPQCSDVAVVESDTPAAESCRLCRGDGRVQVARLEEVERLHGTILSLRWQIVQEAYEASVEAALEELDDPEVTRH